MKTIWKYELKIGENDILMPANSVPLDVKLQYNIPVMWVLVDTETKHKAWYHFNIYGTGHPMPEDPGTYVGTFMYLGGLVFHVFMEGSCDPE